MARRVASQPAATDDGLRARGRGRWELPALVVLATVVYAGSLSGPFILDDQSSVVQNADIRDLRAISRVLLPEEGTSVAGRPLASLSFALNYAAGGLDPRGYHVVNVALHAWCTALLFAVLRRTLARPDIAAALAWPPGAVAGGAAAIWAVHPLTSEVVAYLTQRTESLMAACLLGTLYAAIRAADGRRGWTALAVAACAAGALAKESMVVAPVLVALYDRVFLFPSWAQAWRRRQWLYAGFAISWVLLALLVLTGPRAAVSGATSGVSAWTYLLNQGPIILRYLRLTVWPSDLVVFYGWPQPVGLADVAGPVSVVACLGALTVAGLLRTPRWGYLGAWCFLTLAPASSVVAIATEVGAERRMYLPLMALVTLAVVAAAVGMRRFAGGSVARRALPAAALAVVCAALAAATVLRVREYASPVGLFETLVTRRSTPVAFHILGEQLIAAGRERDAVAPLQRAVALGDGRARFPLGVTLVNLRRHDEALDVLGAFVRLEGVPQVPRWLEPPVLDVLRARVVIATVLSARGRWAEAAGHARAVVARAPRHAEARGLLAQALLNLRELPEAVAQYRVYVEQNPRDVAGTINLGIAVAGSGDLVEAERWFRRAAAMDPANATARRLLEMATNDLALTRR